MHPMGDLANSSDDAMLGTRIGRLRFQKCACLQVGLNFVPATASTSHFLGLFLNLCLCDVRGFIICAQVGPPVLNILNALAIIWFPLTLTHDVH